MLRKKNSSPVPPGDFLIRKECPSCGVEINLDSSTLDKKIRCPKCRRTVVISSDVSVLDNPASKMAVPPRVKNGQTENTEPSIPGNRLAGTMPHANGKTLGDKNGWVVYCLCNGIIKKLDTSSDWKSDKNCCPVCPHKTPLPEDDPHPDDVLHSL